MYKQRRYTVRIRLLPVLLLSVLFTNLCTLPSAQAAPETPDAPLLKNAIVKVNTFVDEWDSDPNTAPKTKCSLREALQLQFTGAAENKGCGKYPADVQEWTISLPAGTYLLTVKQELPNIIAKITMDAPGAIIDGGAQAGRTDGIFNVESGGNLILKNLTLQHGQRPFGGALWLTSGQAVASAEKVTFLQNVADNGPTTGMGGAIRVDTGDLTIKECIFQDNTARDQGGAISGSFMHIEKSKFLKNHAETGGGGAVHIANGNVEITDSVFKENYLNVVTLANPYDYFSDPNGGGALKISGSNVQIVRTEFDSNYVQRARGGGAIHVMSNGEAVISDSAIGWNRFKADPKVEKGFGGGIFNEGDLELDRVSLHHNISPKASAILNKAPGVLTLVNTTIAENQVTDYDSPISNGSPLVGNPGEIYAYHATIAHNISNEEDPVAIYSPQDYKVWLGNTILDTTCSGIVNSYGGNIYEGLCGRVPAKSGIDISSDLSVNGRPAIGLDSLEQHGGPKLNVGFYSYSINSDSPAIDSAGTVNGDEICASELVNYTDQNGKKRASNGDKCDRGAFEGQSQPPQYQSTPGAGSTIQFPAVFINGGAANSQTTLDLTNKAGGSISFVAQVVSAPNIFTIDNANLGASYSGALLKDQHVVLNLKCTPTPGQLSDYYGELLVKTDLKETNEFRYKLFCATPSLQGSYMGAPQKPGPVSAGTAAPGEQTMVSANFANLGNQPLNATPQWSNPKPGVWEFVATKGAVAAASTTEGTANPIVLNPNETLQIDMICKPDGPGVLVNTLQIATDDPRHPLLEYNVSCEGVLPPVAEKVQPAEFYAVPNKKLAALALSPDGTQLLAGDAADANVQLYRRAVDSGQLTAIASVARLGMGQITDIQYSHDGKYIYWTSFGGNGVVIAKPNGNFVDTLDVVTKDTTYICGFINRLPIFCPIGSMAGASSLALSPDDQNVYVTGQSDGTLTAFTRDVSTGGLFATQWLTRTINGVNLLGGANRVVVSKDGHNLYALSNLDNALTVFTRTPDGHLHFLDYRKDTIFTNFEDPADLVLSPDDQFLYVTAHGGSTLWVYRRVAGNGGLTFVQSLTGLSGAAGLNMSHDPEGIRLTVALQDGKAIQLFQRDPQSGKLTFLEGHSNGAEGNLNAPWRLAAPSNDAQIYAALADGMGVRKLDSLRLAPVAVSTSPSSAPAGSGDLVLTVTGDRFYATSQIVWNGQALATTLIDKKQLQATVPAAQLATAGAVNIQVHTPQPGGGDSGALGFVITAPSDPPTPSIESLNPPAASYASEPLNVVVKGANFTPQSQALLNGGPVKTTFINTTMLLVELSAEDLTAPGSLGITVVNGAAVQAAAAGQATATTSSAPFKFTTAAPGQAALPAISSFDPASVSAGTAGFALTLLGHNFSAEPGATTIVHWNGAERTTTVLDDQRLSVQLLDSDLAAAGTASVTVYTPGVGESSPANFVVRAPGENPAPQVTGYIALDNGGQVELTVSGNDFANGAQLKFNGADRPVTAVSANALVATLSRDDLTTGGALQVVNPAPGGGASNTLPMLAQQTLVFLPLVNR